MDFQQTEMMETIHGLATETLGRFMGRRIDGFDRAAWTALAEAGLLGVDDPLELMVLLTAVGRCDATVPVWATLVAGAAPIRKFATAEQQERWLDGVAEGRTLLTGALADGGSRDPLRPATTAKNGCLTGRKLGVPYAAEAKFVVVPAMDGDEAALFVVEGARIEARIGTSPEPTADVVLEETPATRIGGAEAVRWHHERAVVGACAVQLGVAQEALNLTAKYVSTRHQFGKPIGTFQAVAHRAADAWIDTQAMEVTLLRAAWLLSEERDASRSVGIARYHACEGAHRVLTAAQHLHAGIGFDRDYPLHRYFFAAKQLEFQLGGSTEWVARLAEGRK